MDEWVAILQAIRRQAQESPPKRVVKPMTCTAAGVRFDVVDETNGTGG